MKTPSGTLYTCYEGFTRNGRVTTEKLWLWLPKDGERRFLGLVAELSADQALALVGARGGR